MGTIEQRIEELEIRKKEITSLTGELAQKINEIKDLAKQQDMVRHENNSAMLAIEAMLQEPVHQQVILKVDVGESKRRDH